MQHSTNAHICFLVYHVLVTVCPAVIIVECFVCVLHCSVGRNDVSSPTKMVVIMTPAMMMMLAVDGMSIYVKSYYFLLLFVFFGLEL